MSEKSFEFRIMGSQVMRINTKFPLLS